MTCTYRTGIAGGPGSGDLMADHLLEETLTPEQAAELRDHGVGPSSVEGTTAAVPRQDLTSSLADLLGINAGQSLCRQEVANLLAGVRADGARVPGRIVPRAGRALTEILGVDPERLPTAAEIGRIMRGYRADGRMVGERTPGLACARLLELYGVPRGRVPSGDELAHVENGRRADGRDMSRSAFRDGIATRRQPVAYLDLTLSADKSVSVAWALAPTAAERAIIADAHRAAVAFTLSAVEFELGRARRGRGGAGGFDQGAIAWVTFAHYTARPTVAVAPPRGSGEAIPISLRVPGDPQLHSHAAIPNVVLTPSGRVGGLDLARLAGRVHVIGALYHARLATELRQVGAEVVLDAATGAARLSAIPSALRDAFSKRTRYGVGAARAFARRLGLDWDQLTPARQVALAKQGVQGDPAQVRVDDCSDVEAWREQASALGWQPQSVLGQSRTMVVVPRELRLEQACETTVRILEQGARGGRTPSPATIELAAARSLIAAGIEATDDPVQIIRRLAYRDQRLDVGTGTLRFVVGKAARGGEEVRAIAEQSDGQPAGPYSREPDAAVAFRDGRGADALAIRRQQGTAILVEGDADAVAQAVAAAWWTRRAVRAGRTSPEMAVVVPANGTVAPLALAMQRRLQQTGEIGRDLMTMPAQDGRGDHFELAVAEGDRVRLLARANAAFEGGGNGIIGGAGSVLTVVGADEIGLVMQNTGGRRGRVRWSTLRDKASGLVQLEHAWVQRDSPTPVEGPSITVLPDGSGAAGVHALLARTGMGDSLLILSAAAERRQLGRELDEPIWEDELWDGAAAVLSPPPPSPTLQDLLTQARKARQAAVRVLQHSRLKPQQREVDGHTPYPVRRLLRDRQAARALHAAMPGPQALGVDPGQTGTAVGADARQGNPFSTLLQGLTRLAELLRVARERALNGFAAWSSRRSERARARLEAAPSAVAEMPTPEANTTAPPHNPASMLHEENLRWRFANEVSGDQLLFIHLSRLEPARTYSPDAAVIADLEEMLLKVGVPVRRDPPRLGVEAVWIDVRDVALLMASMPAGSDNMRALVSELEDAARITRATRTALHASLAKQTSHAIQATRDPGTSSAIGNKSEVSRPAFNSSGPASTSVRSAADVTPKDHGRAGATQSGFPTGSDQSPASPATIKSPERTGSRPGHVPARPSPVPTPTAAMSQGASQSKQPSVPRALSTALNPESDTKQKPATAATGVKTELPASRRSEQLIGPSSAVPSVAGTASQNRARLTISGSTAGATALPTGKAPAHGTASGSAYPSSLAKRVPRNNDQLLAFAKTIDAKVTVAQKQVPAGKPPAVQFQPGPSKPADRVSSEPPQRLPGTDPASSRVAPEIGGVVPRQPQHRVPPIVAGAKSAVAQERSPSTLAERAASHVISPAANLANPSRQAKTMPSEGRGMSVPPLRAVSDEPAIISTKPQAAAQTDAAAISRMLKPPSPPRKRSSRRDDGFDR